MSTTLSQGTVSGGYPKDRETITCVTSGSLPVSTMARSLRRPIALFLTKMRRPRISLRKNSCSMTVAMALPLPHDQNELVDHQRHEHQQVHPEQQQRESDRSGHLDARLAIPGVYGGEFGEETAHIGVLSYWNRFVNNTEKPYKVDRMMIDTTMNPPMKFWPGVLQRSPMVARSFSSKIKNTSAAGSSVTAIT